MKRRGSEFVGEQSPTKIERGVGLGLDVRVDITMVTVVVLMSSFSSKG